MFHVGDKVVHPLHGAGVIEGMVERTIDDTPAWYYVLRPAFGDTELFLPVDGCGRLGVRPYSESKSWNQRYRENMQHIRSGDLCEVAQVIKSLSVRDHARGLSTGEKKMLEQAMQILESELAFALDRPAERIAEMLREHLCR